VDQVREVLGEQVIGLLAMLGRHQACRNPDSRLTVTSGDGFPPEVARALTKQLALLRKHPRYPDLMRSLAADLRGWALSQPTQAKALELKADPEGNLVMTCRPLTPVLEPLDD
jgi:hypothetical protein